MVQRTRVTSPHPTRRPTHITPGSAQIRVTGTDEDCLRTLEALAECFDVSDARGPYPRTGADGTTGVAVYITATRRTATHEPGD